jgi:hypothetical protein
MPFTLILSIYLFSFKTAVMKYYFLMSAMLLSSALWSQQWAKQYDYVDDFSNGLALVSKGDKKGFVNSEGKLVVPLIYDEAMHFNEGMAAVKKGGNWGFLDSTGKEAIPFEYSEAYSFTDGFGLVIKNNHFGFIDRSGKIAIPMMYDNASSFSEGLAVVSKKKCVGLYRCIRKGSDTAEIQLCRIIYGRRGQGDEKWQMVEY